MTEAREHRDDAVEREFEHSLVTAIQEASPDGVLVVNEAGVIVSHNRRLFEVFGIAPEEIPGGEAGVLTDLSDELLLSRVLALVQDRETFLARVRELYADPELDDHCEIALKDGRTLERHSRALWNSQRVSLGRVWFFRDITEHKQIAAALQHLAHHDALTGVANRRHFMDRASAEFERARRYARPLSFVMIDVDHFKSINDRFGHGGGDAVLKDLCGCARASLRQQDLFARFGGEEFVVMVPETDTDGAVVVADRLRRLVASRAVADAGQVMRYTFSAGVATLSAQDTSAESVLRRADQALYAAKHEGRNRVNR